MTVTRMSTLCMVVFVVMCVAFLPIALGIFAVHALPGPVRVTGAIAVVVLLWWGPFAYYLYLTLTVIKNGDRRLLRRGVRGTAVVLAVTRTNTYIRTGSVSTSVPARVYKYRLEVRVPGWEPYETDCAICATGFGEMSRVDVAVAPHNRKRVAIDVERDPFGAHMTGAW